MVDFFNERSPRKGGQGHRIEAECKSLAATGEWPTGEACTWGIEADGLLEYGAEHRRDDSKARRDDLAYLLGLPEPVASQDEGHFGRKELRTDARCVKGGNRTEQTQTKPTSKDPPKNDDLQS